MVRNSPYEVNFGFLLIKRRQGDGSEAERCHILGHDQGGCWTSGWGIFFKPSTACPQMCPRWSNPLEVNGVLWFVERQKKLDEQPARRCLETVRVAKNILTGLYYGSFRAECLCYAPKFDPSRGGRDRSRLAISDTDQSGRRKSSVSIVTEVTPFVDSAQSLAGSFNRAHVGGSADGVNRGGS